MQLSALEADFFGDLAQDDHALYEVFHLVRLHHPKADDTEVLRRGRELVAAWLRRGWLVVAPEGLAEPGTATETLLVLIDQHGTAGTYHFDGAPRLALGPAAYRDVEWIGPAV